jgi:hypothetical protein
VSSNPEDPRTAGIGYDQETQTVRVMWGDGGRDYNYYNVEPQVAATFMSPSKTPSPGRYINRVLNSYPYGPA